MYTRAPDAGGREPPRLPPSIGECDWLVVVDTNCFLSGRTGEWAAKYRLVLRRCVLAIFSLAHVFLLLYKTISNAKQRRGAPKPGLFFGSVYLSNTQDTVQIERSSLRFSGDNFVVSACVTFRSPWVCGEEMVSVFL